MSSVRFGMSFHLFCRDWGIFLCGTWGRKGRASLVFISTLSCYKINWHNAEQESSPCDLKRAREKYSPGLQCSFWQWSLLDQVPSSCVHSCDQSWERNLWAKQPRGSGGGGRDHKLCRDHSYGCVTAQHQELLGSQEDALLPTATYFGWKAFVPVADMVCDSLCSVPFF